MNTKPLFLLAGLSLGLTTLSAKETTAAVRSVPPDQSLREVTQPKPRQLAATKVGRFFRGLFGGESKPSENTAAKPAANTTIDLSKFSRGQLDSAIKQALGQGLTNAVSRLGRAGGFLTNQSVRIPMPPQLKSVESGLRRFRQDAIADHFVKTMNEAAEKAVPLAAPIFHDALRRMSVEDAAKILAGPQDSATAYFRQETSAELKKLFLTKVQATTSKVGLTSAYQQLIERVRFGARFLNYDVKDLDQYVSDKALDGLFKLVAEEERKIRQDPVARSTDLLKSVFGSMLKK